MTHRTTSRILNPNETLAQVLALEHAQESINCIVHAPCAVVLRVESALLNPLGDGVVTSRAMLGDVGIEDQEATPGEAFADNLDVVLQPVSFGRGSIIVL
jgi:hypothetical protein